VRIAVKRPFLKIPGVSFIPPAEWSDLHCAVSWIAFGTALQADMWDAVLFPGARRWANPSMFMLALQTWWTGDRERTPLPAIVAHMLSLDGGVAEGPSISGTRASHAAVRQSAEQAYLRLRRLEMRSSAGDGGPTIQAMNKAILLAAILLRDRCGLGEVHAKG
jgi:hypothetical protein